MLAVLAATILSYAVARTITRPLATITNVMREMSATGDLTRKISLRRAASWEDEDAKLLATTFNTLTDSIARFQREAAQRERLSALGRLSTVIAHEIRNPLMIIKASLRTLANEHVSRAEIKQALTDVDEEVVRLNRIVNDVLDFARPIRFDYAPADVNALCADVEQATRGRRSARCNVVIKPDPALGPIVTDAERLRTALVNILTNARHAVAARQSATSWRRRRWHRATPCLCVPGHRDRDRRPARIRPHRRPRPRHRRETRRSAARLRSVLHDQTHGLGPRSRDRQKHHRGHGRRHRAREPCRQRHRDPHRFCPSREACGMAPRGGTLLLVDDEQKIRRTLGPGPEIRKGTTCSKPAAFARRSAR